MIYRQALLTELRQIANRLESIVEVLEHDLGIGEGQ